MTSGCNTIFEASEKLHPGNLTSQQKLKISKPERP